MGFDVEAHDDHFKKNAPDEKWLLRVGRKNWRVLTADQEMETLHHAEIVEANAGVFVLSDLAQGETCEKWIEMIRACEMQLRHSCCRAKRPFVGRISRDGVLYRIRHLKSHRRTEDITAEISADAEVYNH
ncbi:MAG: hypothetical protein QOK38_1759 [Acidobacteriaceae bacterium]|nr:hypothetical protein [Acidobacteriaceae bacterium]